MSLNLSILTAVLSVVAPPQCPVAVGAPGALQFSGVHESEVPERALSGAQANAIQRARSELAARDIDRAELRIVARRYDGRHRTACVIAQAELGLRTRGKSPANRLRTDLDRAASVLFRHFARALEQPTPVAISIRAPTWNEKYPADEIGERLRGYIAEAASKRLAIENDARHVLSGDVIAEDDQCRLRLRIGSDGTLPSKIIDSVTFSAAALGFAQCRTTPAQCHDERQSWLADLLAVSPSDAIWSTLRPVARTLCVAGQKPSQAALCLLNASARLRDGEIRQPAAFRAQVYEILKRCAKSNDRIATAPVIDTVPAARVTLSCEGPDARHGACIGGLGARDTFRVALELPSPSYFYALAYRDTDDYDVLYPTYGAVNYLDHGRTNLPSESSVWSVPKGEGFILVRIIVSRRPIEALEHSGATHAGWMPVVPAETLIQDYVLRDG